MAKTSYVDVPAGTEDLYNKGLKPGDRFNFPRIIRNDTLLSKRRKAGVTAKSLLPQLSALWQAMSDAERLAWTNAGAMCSLKGWQLFVQDQSIRIKNDMGSPIVPVTTHQSWVGEIKIASPATEIQIVQYHPSWYWVQKKVYKSKNMYYPLKISEGIGLPLQIGLSYKSNLTAVGANPYAKFYAKIWNSYQGQDDEYELSIPLDLVADWKTETATLSTLRGSLIGYNLYFTLHDLQGELYFDNIKSIHNGTNYARDPFCKDIDQTFTKVYNQVPKHWAADILPEGAEYDSVYKDF